MNNNYLEKREFLCLAVIYEARNIIIKNHGYILHWEPSLHYAGLCRKYHYNHQHYQVQ
jgi:hypothetical protein